MFRATVYVTLRESVLDAQGNAVKKSLNTLGLADVQDVRIGKYIELVLNEANKEAAAAKVKEMCEKLLVNTVVEDYRFELEENQGPSA